ncbi:intermembrane phospholipid transport protein YdbH family protein [Arsukibacterium indicum]|uniref:YdbH domain-containing protein n=1 Tax=Arsukibacterium indicum TaxID=2848612 RepID=A0ABS6MR35_9GAMM|nr:YdbH domain-containing protein [Arsukibacterium indicum]MBV2131055.1 YdbH domain-containing protein [Arsukibacterium indicum]
MKRLLKALLIFVIGIPVLAAAGYWYLQQQIAAAGITELQLDIKRLTLRSVSLASVSFELAQNGSLHQVNLQNVEVNWHWPTAFNPVLQRVTVGPGQISLGQPAATATAAESAVTLPTRWQLPDWLPNHIQLNNTRLSLPCPAGQCQLLLNGYLTYVTDPQHSIADKVQPDNSHPAYWQSQLTVSPLSSQLVAAGSTDGADPAINNILIDASYQPVPEPTLQITLQQQNQFALSIKQHIAPASMQANTEVVLALSPPLPANQTLLQQWGVALPQAWLTQFQQPVQLYGKLHWQLPANGDLTTLFSNHDIEATLVARVPDPFYLPAIGLIQGELNAELRLKNQLVERWQFNATGRLSELELPATLSEYSLTLSPLQFTVSAKTSEPLNLAALPLQLQLSSDGANRLKLDSELTVDLSAGPTLRLGKADLQLNIDRLELANKAATLTALALKTRLTGYWQSESWQFQLTDNSTLSGGVSSDTLSVSNIKVLLKNSQINGDETGLTTFGSKLDLSVNSLSLPALLSLNWQWQGLLSGSPSQITVKDGQLSNDAGISLAHQLTYQTATGELAGQWQLAEVFLLAGNPLAGTLTDWPELLTLNRGKISASGNIKMNNNKFSSTSQLQLGDAGGIYDRSLFAGLNATVDVTINENTLQLNSDNLQLNRLNHGIEMGPLNISASASVPLATPDQLTVNLRQAELQLMQGKVTANQQQLDFSQNTNQIVVQLQQIDLASLLQQHPSSDLTGNGKLSGTVPILVSNNGVSVNDGRIAAEAPGGRLQYQSASASAMAKSNSNMKLVFDALQDFHYSVLSSDISYDTSGKLVLGLKLQGRNPNLQQGRPINLNVNLEEDLPALITSLQLTNKLNDLITQRVRQYLKQQQAAAAANGEKP